MTQYFQTKGVVQSGGFLSFLSFVLLPILAFSLGWSVHARVQVSAPTTELVNTDATVVSENMIDSVDVSLLRDALAIVKEKFVNPNDIDPERIKYGIVRGMISALEDPYSEFMSPEESQDFESDLAGDLEGIGAELTVRNGSIVVVSPLRDSPAEAAGLLPEDIILKVDGEEASGEDFLTVIKKIRGKKGTSVTLTVFRASSGEEKEIIIIRAKIHIESVKLSWEEGNIAVLEVSQFGGKTTEEFLSFLSQAISEGARGLVLDLRFNSGGYLNSAVDMVSAFEKTGKIVIQKGRPPETTSLYATGKVLTDLPLVVLQNKGSASASEIVAGALQDLGRATIIGNQSFGKGTVQEVVPMKGGAHLRITTHKWLTPKGRDIISVGIEPDIFIEKTGEDFENDIDPQMDIALRVLGGASVEEIVQELKEAEEESAQKETVVEEASEEE